MQILLLSEYVLRLLLSEVKGLFLLSLPVFIYLFDIILQEGATKEDIERLPTFRFRKIGDFEKQNGEIQESFGGIMTECDTDSPTEHVLPLDDAVCRIRLYIPILDTISYLH